jgi:hypothetical protein
MPATKKAAPKKLQNKRSTRVTNQVTINATTPIPFEHNGQAFSYINNYQYIPFLASESYNYAESLLEARLLSTTHNACVTTKKDYIAGNGFYDRNGKELDQNTRDWFRSMNLKNDNAVEINKQIIEAHLTFGNEPIEVVRFTVMGKKNLFVYPHNFLEWRLCKADDNDIVTHAVQSKLFLRKTFLTADEWKKSRKLPIYNPRNSEKKNWFKDAKGVERTLIWFKNSVTGFPHYGLPSAVSSLINQILEYKGSRYNLDNFDNNMVIGGVLALTGSLGQDEANKIGKQIINTHTGDGKRGRIAVVASEEGIEKSAFHNFDTTKDGSFTEADGNWTQKIILANQWDAILAGLVSASTLGKGEGFLTKIIEHKEKTVIKPAQTDLLQKVWHTIFTIAQSFLGLPFDQYDMAIRSFVDISSLSDVDITPVVKANEVREAKGLGKLEGPQGEMLLGELNASQKKKGGTDV